MTQQPLPGVIPYVDFHQGPRRVATLQLTTGLMGSPSTHPPVVGIDGRQFRVIWGAVPFEVPADRNVHVSVHVESDRVSQVASMLLPPGERPVVLHYATDWASGTGSLTQQE